MPAFQFYNPAPVFLDLLGIAVLDGGSLTFYDLGTTNPRDTWNDPAMQLGDLNPNPVPLDSAGRANAPIFLDGEYTVLCKDAGGATIWTRDVIPGGDDALTIPALETGKFLTNDGTNLLWQTIRQMPDATGSTGQVPVTNGGGANAYTLTDLPEAPELDITIDDDPITATIGDGVDATKLLIQADTDSAPANPGSTSTTKAVTFAVAYSATPVVTVTPTSVSQPGGPTVLELTTVSTTGFTVSCDVAEGSSSDQYMVNAVPFNWIAVGTKEVP